MAAAEDLRGPTLNHIPAENIDSVLPLVDTHLKLIAERARGTIDRDSAIKAFKDGVWQLWIIWDDAVIAVGATELITYPSGLKVCAIKFITGENSLDWLHTLEDLEAWAKHQGCSRVSGNMRRGWAKRIPHYRLSYVHLEKELA